MHEGWHEAYTHGDANTYRYPDYVSVEGPWSLGPRTKGVT